MKKIVFFFLLLIFLLRYLCEIIVKERELIKIRITIGATNYFRYIQLSSPDYSNSFKIIKREE